MEIHDSWSYGWSVGRSRISIKNSIENFLTDLNLIIQEVLNNINARKLGIDGDGNIYELENILRELVQIKNMLINGGLPCKSERYTGFTRIVTDTWNFNSTLGKKLCELANRYKKL